MLQLNEIADYGCNGPASICPSLSTSGLLDSQIPGKIMTTVFGIVNAVPGALKHPAAGSRR
jgi:hypothetical protein